MSSRVYSVYCICHFGSSLEHRPRSPCFLVVHVMLAGDTGLQLEDGRTTVGLLTSSRSQCSTCAKYGGADPAAIAEPGINPASGFIWSGEKYPRGARSTGGVDAVAAGFDVDSVASGRVLELHLAACNRLAETLLCNAQLLAVATRGGALSAADVYIACGSFRVISPGPCCGTGEHHRVGRGG